MRLPFRTASVRNCFPARITVEQDTGRKRFQIGELSFERIRLKVLCPASRTDIFLDANDFARGAAIWFKPERLPIVLKHAEQR